MWGFPLRPQNRIMAEAIINRKRGLFLQRVRSQREAELVLAAAHVLLRRGCREFRVEHVTDACGIAKGTCYQHFTSQADLIAAAVRSLDEALAGRLLAPHEHLTEPHQVLEWALLEAVDAQIVAITQRTRQAALPASSDGALQGNAWPCCFSLLPCPHGGAIRSHKALLRWMPEAKLPARVSPGIPPALLLALVPAYGLGLDHRGKLPNPRTVRSVARQLIRQLFPQKKPRA